MKNFIKQLREEKRISIKELAEALGMTYQNARDIDANRIVLSAKHLDKLCNLFNCSVAEIFGEKQTTKNSIKLKYYENHNDLLNIDSCEYELFDISDKMLNFFNITNTFNIICIRAWENNMKPTILKDNFLLIDISDKIIKHKSIYLLKQPICNNKVFEDEVKIKQILLENPFSQTVIIKSLEEMAGDFPPYEIKIEELQKMIIGRVIYCGKPI